METDVSTERHSRERGYYDEDFDQSRESRRRGGRERGSVAKRLGGSAGGAGLVALIGAGVAALAIIGLAGAAPITLQEIALIGAGGGLMLLGMSFAPAFRQLVDWMPEDERPQSTLGAGLGVFTFGGAGVAALGILALVGVASRTLTQIGVLASGGVIALGAISIWTLARARVVGHREFENDPAAETTRSVAGLDVVLGLGGVALGILALAGVASLTLNLVAFIAYGAAMMATGGAVSYKIGRLMEFARGQDRERGERHRERGEWREEQEGEHEEFEPRDESDRNIRAAAEAERIAADAERRSADAERRAADAERRLAEAERNIARIHQERAADVTSGKVRREHVETRTTYRPE